MTELATKHLDYLQAAITRMAGNSFVARGWSLTLASGLIGIAAKDGHPVLAWLALFPIALFWLFDSYFLALEKRFRDLFVEAARGALAGEAPTLNMNPGPIALTLVLNCAIRPVMLLSHGTMVLVAVLVAKSLG